MYIYWFKCRLRIRQDDGLDHSTAPATTTGGRRLLDASGIQTLHEKRVFITFGGPQGHDDRMASCAAIGNRRFSSTDTGSGRPIANRPQATSLPHNAGDPKIVAAREETKM